MFEGCSARVNPLAEDAVLLPDDLQVPLLLALNNRLAPYRKGPINLQKALLGYSILGGLILCIFATIFGLFVSFWFSVAIALFYFLGLFVMITFHSKRGKLLEKRMMFNMAILVMNLN